MADRKRHVVDVGFLAFVGDGALDFFSTDKVGTVEDDDFKLVAESLFGGGGFDEVSGLRFVGVEPDSCILQVDDDGIEVFKLVVSWVAGLRGFAVERGNGDVCCGIDLAVDAGLVFGAEEAVLRREECLELEAGNGFSGFGGDEVDGAAAVGVEAGLVGEDADAKVIAVAVGGFGEGGVVGGFENVDTGEGGCLRLASVEVERLSSGGGDLTTKAGDGGIAAWVHGVGEQDDVGV